MTIKPRLIESAREGAWLEAQEAASTLRRMDRHDEATACDLLALAGELIDAADRMERGELPHDEAVAIVRASGDLLTASSGRLELLGRRRRPLLSRRRRRQGWVSEGAVAALVDGLLAHTSLSRDDLTEVDPAAGDNPLRTLWMVAHRRSFDLMQGEVRSASWRSRSADDRRAEFHRLVRAAHADHLRRIAELYRVGGCAMLDMEISP